MKGVLPDGTGEVAVGARSVWVGHGGEQPRSVGGTARPEDGSLQKPVLDPRRRRESPRLRRGRACGSRASASGKLRKIDPRTNKIVLTREAPPATVLRRAGGGYVWVAINPDAAVWKVSTDGSVLRHHQASRVDQERHVRRRCTLGRSRRGRDSREDRSRPRTSRGRTTSVTHVKDVDVRNGLVAVGVRQSTKDATAGLEGDIVRVARAGRLALQNRRAVGRPRRSSRTGTTR